MIKQKTDAKLPKIRNISINSDLFQEEFQAQLYKIDFTMIELPVFCPNN